MQEKTIEHYLIEEVKKLDGIPYKFKSPQRRSVPDRLCIFNKKVTIFVEAKATGEEPTEAQYREMDRLEDKEQWVEWVDSKDGVDRIMKKIKFMLGGDKI